MTRDEVERILRENDGRRVRVTFVDGVVQRVDIASVDDEGSCTADRTEPIHADTGRASTRSRSWKQSTPETSVTDMARDLVAPRWQVRAAARPDGLSSGRHAL